MVKRELRGLRNYIGEKRVLGLAFKAREHVVKTVERGENLWLHAHNEHNTRRDSCIPRRTTIYVDRRYMRSRTVQTTLQGQPHNPCTAQAIPFRSMSPLKKSQP